MFNKISVRAVSNFKLTVYGVWRGQTSISTALYEVSFPCKMGECRGMGRPRAKSCQGWVAAWDQWEWGVLFVSERTSPLQDTELSGEGFGSSFTHQRFKQAGIHNDRSSKSRVLIIYIYFSGTKFFFKLVSLYRDFNHHLHIFVMAPYKSIISGIPPKHGRVYL